jgi:phosphotransacetylase
MVQAIINIEDHTNRVLNIVKAKFGLKDKSKAIDLMAEQYEKEILDPVLRPEYIEKLHKIKKEKGVKFKSMQQLREHIENA